MRKDPATSEIAVLALPEVVAFDLTIATHVFGPASGGRYRFTLCTPEPGAVPTTSGFPIGIEAGLDAVARAGTVIVPGYDRGPVPQAVRSALRSAHERGARMASICTGALALAAAGLLDGRRATTHWMHAPELIRRHPHILVDPAVLYVDDGDVLTSAGVAAGLDLCLHMVARDHGEQAAVDVARRMVTPLHRAGGQAQFIPPGADAASPQLQAVLSWATANLHRPLSVGDLARRAWQAPRTFARTFQVQLGMSPHAWLIRERLHAVCTLLENPDLSIEEIARRTGMGSAANLRLHFRRAYATSPTAYRTAFHLRDQRVTTTRSPEPAAAVISDSGYARVASDHPAQGQQADVTRHLA